MPSTPIPCFTSGASELCFDAVDDGVPLSPVPQVIAAIAAGQPVLVLDDADRENEADLVCAAANMTPACMAMMIREGSGIVCLCITADHAQALGLRPMVEVNRSAHGTAFTQSIEAAHGISTGVSAIDACRPCAVPCAFQRWATRRRWSAQAMCFLWWRGLAACWSAKAIPRLPSIWPCSRACPLRVCCAS